MLSIQREEQLSADEFVQVLKESGLDARRPVDDAARIAKMLAHGNLIVTARDDGKLVGVSRSLTDFAFCCYLSDLAVSKNCQKGGVGRRLIEHTATFLHPKATIILLSAPAAVDFYPKVGFELHPAAYVKKAATD